MIPAWEIGRLRPGLRAATAADARGIERLPRQLAETVPVVLVVVLAATFAALHGLHQYYSTQPNVEWARLSVANTYLELPIFLFLAILVGVVSPPLGVVFVLMYAGLDIVASGSQPDQTAPLPGALAGRLVSFWLLWLLVVEIPVFARSLAVSSRALSRNRVVLAVLAAVVTGAFTWFWTQAAPILIRPMFVWSNIGRVSLAAVMPVQSAGAVFAICAAVVAGAVALSRGASGLLIEGSDVDSRIDLGRGLGIARTLTVAALLTTALGGVLASPLEAVAMFAVLASAGPLARFVADRTILGSLVRVTPLLLRYVVATGISFGVSVTVIGSLYESNVAATIRNPASEFFSVLFALAVAFFLIALVTTPGASRRTKASVASTATTLMVVGGAFLALILITPVAAFADNCSGLTDCWPTALLAALAGGGLPMAMAAAMRPAKQPPPPPAPPPHTPPGPPPPEADNDRQKREKDNRDRAQGMRDRKREYAQNPLSKNDGPGLQKMENAYFDKMIKYWESNPPRDQGDGRPVRLGAIASSGAAGRM
jgi:hypothetical protein